LGLCPHDLDRGSSKLKRTKAASVASSVGTSIVVAVAAIAKDDDDEDDEDDEVVVVVEHERLFPIRQLGNGLSGFIEAWDSFGIIGQSDGTLEERNLVSVLQADDIVVTVEELLIQVIVAAKLEITTPCASL
jgi:hypothetical protein